MTMRGGGEDMRLHLEGLIERWERGILDADDGMRELRTTLIEEREISERDMPDDETRGPAVQGKHQMVPNAEEFASFRRRHYDT